MLYALAVDKKGPVHNILFKQCWLRTGWFKAYPDPDKDPEGYDMGDEYWYYADKKG